MDKFKRLLTLVIIYLLNLFPIKRNKIFFFSYYGNQYGCSPKYITEYIMENYPKDQFDIVWAFNTPSRVDNSKGFRKVKIMSFKYFYELCTSKIIITNFRTTDLFIKRKNQYYIQTWHSSLRLKQIEKDAENTLPTHYVEMAKKDSRKCDLLLSGCELSTDIFKRVFWYEGNIFEHGTPRNDLLFQKDTKLREEILKSLNIPDDYKVVLYAPTFRKGDSLEVYNLNYTIILKSLRSKFGSKWIFLIKLHPHLISKSSELVFGNDVKDVTAHDDIQELLYISDILISDYSSLMFDYAITSRPCFLYVPDLMDYVKNDRNLYFDIKELPFISASSNNDLIEKINNFNSVEYNKQLSIFFKTIGSFEEGKSCEYLLKHINEVCFTEKRRKYHEAV